MRGNFPAGKREGRDRREEPLILDTRRYPGEKIKGHREPVGTLRSRQNIKNKNITKNRNLLKYLLIITSLILTRFRRFYFYFIYFFKINNIKSKSFKSD